MEFEEDNYEDDLNAFHEEEISDEFISPQKTSPPLKQTNGNYQQEPMKTN
jgi:hypothetical protein